MSTIDVILISTLALAYVATVISMVWFIGLCIQDSSDRKLTKREARRAGA